MSYGAMILLENGNPFVTPQSTPFCLYRKVVVNSDGNGVASADIPIDPSWPAIAFCRISNTSAPTYTNVARTGGVIRASSATPVGAAKTPHTLTVYVFAIFPQTLPAWGFAIWDAAGKLVLTNESRVLSDLVTVGTAGAGGGINIDQTLAGSWAVAPATLGMSLWQIMVQGQPVIISIAAYTGCRFDGVNTRINAVGNQVGQGSPAGGSNTGITLTAINTAMYD
ncbi:hypothetical protein V5080_18675 [Atlantibacter hermannii]|uniref:hypothetical protein n=1 Tax=Atlantibacter hermannii TaxID=565 RepID=UPI003075FE5B